MIAEKDLFGKLILENGNISKHCNVIKDDKTVFISIKGNLMYQYQINDKVSMRMAWVDIYEHGFVTYKEAAIGANVTNTSVKNWVKKFREYGFEGLLDKTGKGSAHKLPPETIEKIFELRKQRKSMNEIARLCGCSNAIVCKKLQEQKKITHPDLGFSSEKEEPQEIIKETTLDKNNIDGDKIEIIIENEGNHHNDINKNDLYNQHVLDDKLEARMSKDRSGDRMLAVAGKLYDAQPLFAPNRNLEFAGMFIAFIILAQDAYLRIGLTVFKHIGPAFYGLRTTLMTLITLALLRIKRPEQLLEKNPEKLGAILGLDRILSVKTCRRKIQKMSEPVATINYMKTMGKARSDEYNGDTHTVMVDGHTIGYFGGKKVGSTWSARDNKVLKGHTENWVNLPGKAPLFSLETEFNNGLVTSLEDVLIQTKDALKTDSLTCVFDRGGSSALLFERLTKKEFGIITYQKGNYDKIEEDKFKKVKVKLGSREYNYLPYEQEVILDVYEVKDNGPNKRQSSKKTNRTIKMRDIRILCDDGHQVSIIANSCVKKSSEEIADIIFQRIGSQENIFKYMRKEFDVDGLVSYDFEDVSEDVEHPNPKWIKQEKKIGKLRVKQNSLLAKVSDELLLKENTTKKEMIVSLSNNNISLLSKKNKDRAEKITTLNNKIIKEKEILNTIPYKENARNAKYKKPKPEPKRFMNIVKIAAYAIETKLFNMLEKHYKYNQNGGRKLIKAALASSGSLKLKDGELVIKLEPQANPRRTKAVNGLLEDLNAMKAKFPGSSRVIRFEKTPIKSKKTVK